ncbi:DUF6351 family protein [Sphingopyxis granuli]|uniref:DUF6351 family protein n=1 Tax=Sphingopyxis granuli TaxID=267128 RepID=UPI00301E4502
MTKSAIRVALLSAASAALALSTGARAQEIEVLSSRPDMVSGGSALVAVTLPDGAAGEGAELRLLVNGSDIRDKFARSGNRLVGLVTGLKSGDNVFEARTRGSERQLILINHDDGPIISGPRQMPFMCQTQDFELPDGSRLGPALDKNCNIATRIDYVYRSSSSPEFKPYLPGGGAPADLATTTTSEGRTVPYIVRVQTGTINRAIYQFAVLFDPSKDAEPQPTATYSAWNRKLVFTFGGGASAGYQQGKGVGTSMTILEDDKLSRGFALASSTLNVFVNAANDVLSAETASMVKEEFIETFGQPVYTMGWGGSGGSMQQFLIANNYPGILDGITPGASFPDKEAIVTTMDCSLLDRVFSSNPGWTDERKVAVAGFASWDVCRSWMALFSPNMLRADQMLVKPLGGRPGNEFDVSNCPRVVPKELTFDKDRNPDGVRCDTYTGIVNQVGIDPKTGHAARAFDNVGVVYGLNAFRAGTISGEQFVSLNEMVGGYDDDGQYQAARTSASPVALKNLYQFGRVNQAANLDLPIIDFRSEPFKSVDLHDSVRSMTTRARLERAHGHSDNFVVVRIDAPPTIAGTGTPSGSPATDVYVLMQMDAWLTAMKADKRVYHSGAERTRANKPAGLSDICVLEDGTRVAERAAIGAQGRCGSLMPYSSNSRMAAGEPITNDYLKCQLRPFRGEDYAGLGAAEIERLRRVFSAGVCDYTVPPEGVRPLAATWLNYTAPGVAVSLGGVN